MSLRWPPKDKDELLDYSLDWSRALATGETIVGVFWHIVDSSGDKVSFNPSENVDGLTSVSQTNTSTVTTIYLANGTDNKDYKLFCNVTTSLGLNKERTVKLRIREYN